jgi:hypothetical protein
VKSDPAKVIRLLSKFTGQDLTRTLGRIEAEVRGLSADDCDAFLEKAGAGREVLAAAAEMKRLAGQINVTIHALGILLCLPHILEQGETVEYVSLGAGNTGREFDLETNLRVAEFKFIRWRGGAESIRQNSIFKDYVLLAESPTPKRKYLYLVGTEHALKFLHGGRALSSVLSRNDKLQKMFSERFGSQFSKVRDYYGAHRDTVQIEDVSAWLSELAEVLIVDAVTDELIEQ